MTKLTNMTKDSCGHLCAIINIYGDGEHPHADLGTLDYFKEGYIRTCLETAYEKNKHMDRRDIVNGIREELKHVEF